MEDTKLSVSPYAAQRILSDDPESHSNLNIAIIKANSAGQVNRDFHIQRLELQSLRIMDQAIYLVKNLKQLPWNVD